MRTYFSFITSLFVLFYVSACAPTHSGSGSSQQSSTGLQDLEMQVLNVLSNHCASCHTSSGQGGINYILDLKMLVSTGQVVPGQPNNSKLYNEVQTNRMPLSYALTDSEKNILASWILSLTPSIETDEPGPAGTFQSVKAILDARCVSCHSESHEIKLTTYSQVMMTVWPGSPASSLLYDSVESGRMPKTGGSLSVDQLKTIRTWIRSGAANN